MRAVLVALVASACGTSQPGPDAPKPLAFEPWSAPQYTSRDVFVGGHADVVVMANRMSRDGGMTWKALDPRFGTVTRAAITDSVVTLYASQLGLVRWDVTTNAITPMTAPPAYASERTWRLDPTSGRVAVFDPVHDAIAIETTAGWTIGTLPQPSPSEVDPFIQDLESNGTTAMTVSAWGVHRSLDAGATWELVTPSVPGAGRDLLVLTDHRFLLLGGTTTYLFDSTGAPVTSTPGIALEAGEATVCTDGAIVANGKISRDLAATWQPIVMAGDLTLTIERVGCGGGRYWMLVRSDAWGYRLVSFTAPGTPALVAGNWETDPQTFTASGPPIVRTDDATFLVAGLAWRDADPAWSLREIPAQTWVAGETLVGVANGKLYVSHDRGATWAAKVATGVTPASIDTVARAADGSLLASTFSGGDSVHATIARSTDDGATWTAAYDATGEVHRFVGVTADGDWIATDAVSHDQGQSWEVTEVKNDHGLAFLTRHGSLVTTTNDHWQLFAQGGAGELHATYAIAIAGAPVAASQLHAVAFDDAGYAYIAGGAPYTQVWRSTTPLD